MTGMNLQAIGEFAASHYMAMIAEAHGDAGVVALRQLIGALHAFYQQIAPELCRSTLTVFRPLDPTLRPLSIRGGRTIRDFMTLPADVRLPCVVQVVSERELILWNGIQIEYQQLAEHSVVYRFEEEIETFYAGQLSRPVPRLGPTQCSAFAHPTFRDLAQALEVYRITWAQRSSCPILSQVWYDSDRLFIKSKPEDTMQEALCNFLRMTMRGSAEIRREQPMDETHPIDIKVTWFLLNRIALIEIKWLGQSKHTEGPRRGELATEYSASRANDGARQLAGYLDMNSVRSPTQVTQGYLVVIDARRAGLSAQTVSLSAREGFSFRDREIEYTPTFHRERPDFAPPIRMFVEPVCRGA